MKRFINCLVGFGIVLLVIFGIYKFFFDGNHIKSYYKREFTLNLWDSATIEDETYVKLIKVSDERCKDDDCIAEGQMVSKIIVANEHSIKFATLGTKVDRNIDLEKTGINIELVEVNEDKEVTFIVTKLKK